MLSFLGAEQTTSLRLVISQVFLYYVFQQSDAKGFQEVKYLTALENLEGVDV